jgi:hypothetical protein
MKRKQNEDKIDFIRDMNTSSPLENENYRKKKERLVKTRKIVDCDINLELIERTELVKIIEKNYREWLESSLEQDYDITGEVEEKLDYYARVYGFRRLIKGDLLIIYKNDDGELLIAWHNDHDRRWGINETGFSDIELNEAWESDLISEKVYKRVMLDISNLSILPKKLRSATKSFLEGNEINKEEYQNIYHNLYKKDPERLRKKEKEYREKAKLSEFFNSITFLKRE